MKITAQTADRMALKDKSILAYLTGLPFLAVAVYFGYTTYVASGITNALWIFVILFISGLAAIFLNTSIFVDLNKASGQILYQQRRLIGSTFATYATADVLRIETRKEWQAENSSRNGISFPHQTLVAQSIIVFKNGQELPLDTQKGSSSRFSIGPAVLMGGGGKESALANQVAQFLGVPFQEVAPPGSGMGVNIGSGRIEL